MEYKSKTDKDKCQAAINKKREYFKNNFLQIPHFNISLRPNILQIFVDWVRPERNILNTHEV